MKKILGYILASSAVMAMWGCENEAAYLTPEKETLEFPCEGGTFTMTVKSNEPSKSVITYNGTESGWIFMLPSALYGDGILEFRVKSYTNIWDDRTATLTITAGDVVREVSLVQLSKPALKLSTDDIWTTGEEHSISVTVESKEEWNATINPEVASWCTLSDASGEGIGAFKINVKAIGSAFVRTGATVTVKTATLTDYVTVQQVAGVTLNGIIWSPVNVGDPNKFVTSLDATGLLYQFNSKVGWPNSSPNPSDAPAGYPIGWTDQGVDHWLDENNPCPDGWRIPTNEEIKAVLNLGLGWVEPTQTGFVRPGTIVGISKAETELATGTNMRGGVFWPQAGYRGNEDGKQVHWWEACITSCTRPGQNWDRYSYWTDFSSSWGEMMYTPNLTAMPVRCVIDPE